MAHSLSTHTCFCIKYLPPCPTPPTKPTCTHTPFILPMRVSSLISAACLSKAFIVVLLLLPLQSTASSYSTSLPFSTLNIYLINSVQLLTCVWLFMTPCTAACRASLSFTISQSLLKLMSLNRWCHPTISSSVVPFSFYLKSFPASGSFPMNQIFASGGQSIGVSASASVLPMNIQDWFPLGWTGLICL